MARIMKVRTVPRGYVNMSEMKGFVGECSDKNPAEWFMALYTKFGNPQEGGKWSYLLRHNNILIKVTAVDGDTLDYDVWVSPKFVLDAKRRKTRALNVIARRLNENRVAFIPKDGEVLYYAVRRKNDELKERNSGNLSEAMEKALTDQEKNALYGGMGQYMPEVKDEIYNTIGEIFDEYVRVAC